MRLKRFIVGALEDLCLFADGLSGPLRRWTPLRWVGCGRPVNLALWSERLDQRWGTNVWKRHVHDDECECWREEDGAP